MPYKMNKSLPSRVTKVLPFFAQSVFRHAVNVYLESETREKAFKKAWVVIKRSGFKKNIDGIWEYIGNENMAGQQLFDMRKYMGLNLMELSQIFCVTRFTIESWLKNIINPGRKKQKKINLVHDLCNFWKDNASRTLERYSYKRLNGHNKCLFDLLVQEDIHINRVKSLLTKIAIIQRNDIKRRHDRDLWFQSHGFDSPKLTIEEQRERLIRISRTIS